MESNTLEQAAIHHVIDRLVDAINHHDWTTFLSLFTEDVVWERRPPNAWKLEGKPAVRKFLEGNEVEVLYYEMIAPVIEVRGAGATARSTFRELLRFKKTGASLHLVGTYHDEFVRTEQVWRFSRRTVELRYEEDVTTPARIFGGPNQPASATPPAPAGTIPRQ